MRDLKATQADQESERSNRGQPGASQFQLEGITKHLSTHIQGTESQNTSISDHQPIHNEQHTVDDNRSRSRRTRNFIAHAQSQIESMMKNETLNIKGYLDSQLASIRKDYADMNSKIDIILNTLKPTPPEEQHQIKQNGSEQQKEPIRYDKDLQDGYIITPNGDFFRVQKISSKPATTRNRLSSRSRSRSRSRSCSCTCCRRLIQSRKKGRRQRKNSSDSQESNYTGKMTAEQVRMIVYRLRTGTLSVPDAARKCGRRECVILAWLNVY